MFTAAMLCHGLTGHVLRSRPGSLQTECTGGIALLSPEDAPAADLLYLGTADEVAAFVSRNDLPPGLLMASAGDSPALQAAALPETLTLIVTDLPLVELYNRAHREMHRYDDLLRRMDKILYQNGGLQALVDCVNQVAQVSILVLNAGYKPLAASYNEELDDATTREVREKGYLTFDSVHTLLQQHAVRGNIYSDYSEYISTVSGKYTIIRLLTHESNVVARICIILNDGQPNPFITDLSSVLEKYVSRYMFSVPGSEAGPDNDFSGLIGDLLEYRLSDPAELNERLKQLSLPHQHRIVVPQSFYVMVVAFPEQGQTGAGRRLPWNYLTSQLEQQFPQSCIAGYHGQLLLLIPRADGETRLRFDDTELCKLLDYYDGYAAVGNFSARLTSLPPLYHQANATVRLGMALRKESTDRIFYYEDYSLYHLVEMAVRSLPESCGTANFVYLCHPAQIDLLRYDRANDGGLCEALRTYLQCECNSTETAKRLGIHRNTMLYKIHRIEQIMGHTLDDPAFLDRLRLGFYLLDYAARYLKTDILELKRSFPAPAASQSPLPYLGDVQ